MGIPEGRGNKWMVTIWVEKITVPIKITVSIEIKISTFKYLFSTFFGVKFSFSSLTP